MAETEVTSGVQSNVKLIYYRYDAKYKDILPVWDALPLVFPISYTGNGFYGVNLHFLGPEAGEVLDYVKFQLSISAGESQIFKFLAYFESGLHRYRFDCIRSDIVTVSINDWDENIMKRFPPQFIQR